MSASENVLLTDGNGDRGYSRVVRAVNALTVAGEKLSGQTPVVQPDGSVKWSNSGSVPVGDFIPLAQKGAANGVAELDATGRVPSAQLPGSGGGYSCAKIEMFTTTNLAPSPGAWRVVPVPQSGSGVIETDPDGIVSINATNGVVLSAGTYDVTVNLNASSSYISTQLLLNGTVVGVGGVATPGTSLITAIESRPFIAAAGDVLTVEIYPYAVCAMPSNPQYYQDQNGTGYKWYGSIKIRKLG